MTCACPSIRLRTAHNQKTPPLPASARAGAFSLRTRGVERGSPVTFGGAVPSETSEYAVPPGHRLGYLTTMEQPALT